MKNLTFSFFGKWVLTFFFLFTCFNLFSQEITEEQRQSLDTKIKLFLKDYELYNQLSTDGVSLDNEYIKQFKALFDVPSKTGFFNELSASGKGSFTTPDLYINFVRQFFPQGLDISVDRNNITIVDIKPNQGKFMIYTYIKKKVMGIYNKQGI